MSAFNAPRQFRLQDADRRVHTYGPGLILDPPDEHASHWHFRASTTEVELPTAPAADPAPQDPPAGDPPAGDPPAGDPPADPAATDTGGKKK